VEGRPEFSATLRTQIVECTKRQFRDLWRDSSFAYGVLFSNIVTGFAAGGGFAHLGTSPTELQYRVFVIFLVVLNFPATVNSIISKFWEMRVTFTVREGPSKTYSWFAFMTAFVLVSIPIALVASVLFFLPSFYLPYYSQPSQVAGLWYLMLFLINCYEMFFSLSLAAACPTPVTAANLVPFLLPFIAFCSGVIKPMSTLPEPWARLIYANPFYYYIRSLVATILHDIPVRCMQEDLAIFNPPPGQTCGEYALEWVQSVSGQLLNPDASSSCSFCQYQVGDQFAATLGFSWDFRWKGVGIVAGYAIGQLLFAYAAYWYFTEKGYGIGISVIKSLVNKVKSRGKRTV
jgi:ABC-type multidrug transport system permease subunit